MEVEAVIRSAKPMVTKTFEEFRDSAPYKISSSRLISAQDKLVTVMYYVLEICLIVNLSSF